MEFHHAGENKHFADENKVLKSIEPLHFVSVHQLRNAQGFVCASNDFILNHLLPRNLAEFVAKLRDVCTPRNLKGGIGSLFDPCGNAMGRRPYCL